MSDLQIYLEVADSDKIAEILRRQYKNAAEHSAVYCPCGQLRAITEAFRCLYCGIYFCVDCAERHFGKTRREWFESEKN
jgi:hypothetical protein